MTTSSRAPPKSASCSTAMVRPVGSPPTMPVPAAMRRRFPVGRCQPRRAPMSPPSHRRSAVEAIPAPPSSLPPILSHGPARRCSSRNEQAHQPVIPCRRNARRMMRQVPRHRPLSCAMFPPSYRNRMACSSHAPTRGRCDEREGSRSHDSGRWRGLEGAQVECRQHDRRMAR